MDVAKFFSFDGRISRRTFWLTILIFWGLFIVVAILYKINEVLGVVAYLPLLWVSLATSVKRWHDRGKSGVWVLISAIPIVGPIWAVVETGFLPGEMADNTYGSPESGSPFGERSYVRQAI